MLPYTAIDLLRTMRRLDAGSPPAWRPLEDACRRCPWSFLALARERGSRSRPTAA